MKKREYYLVNYPTWNKNELLEGFPFFTFYTFEITKMYQQYFIPKNYGNVKIAEQILKAQVKKLELFFEWT